MYQNKNIFIMGGAGFCGWPVSLKLSSLGYNVIIFDNLIRNEIDSKFKLNSITKIYSIKKKIYEWNKKNKNILFVKCDLANNIKLINQFFKKFKPKACVMFAELKSAPYSQISTFYGGKTIQNNIISNFNILNSIKNYSKNTHFIHLGTMGVYGYDFSKKLVPDGYYNASLNNGFGDTFKTKLLHPASPGSIYHLSKAQEEIMFAYFKKIYDLDITDLHQGIVWGVNTFETSKSKYLINRFDYDHIYGTVINRFISQAALNHPLTLYGEGNQIRPIIHISDTVNSVVANIENFKKKNYVNILNQLSETICLKNLAKQISQLFNVKIINIKNPRIENENNVLIAKPLGLKKLGINPIKLSDKHLIDLFELAVNNKKRIIKSKIYPNINW